MAASGVDGSVIIEIDADDGKFQRAINGLSTDISNSIGTAIDKAMKDLADRLAEIGEQANRTGDDIDDAFGEGSRARNAVSGLGTTMQNAFGHLIADAVETVVDRTTELAQNIWQAGVSFESAFTGVTKTVDETANISYADLEKQIRDMSKELPSTVEEISAVAEAAGQLGIHTEDIKSFSKTMIDLGNSTNIGAEEAASALAKFANVTKMDPGEYQNLGSAIVDLGNNYATTEQDIVNMATRLAATATTAGISEQGILALSTALSSVGIEAEAGGTAMSTFIKKVQTAVETQSKNLSKYAEVAGMTQEEFTKLFKEDGTQAINAFITGLGELNNNGGSALNILNEMGLKEVRLSNAILALGSAGDLLTRTIGTSNTAWEENSALVAEASKRYETTESKLQMTRNALNDFFISISQAVNIGFKTDPIIDYINALNNAFQEGGLQGLVDEVVEQMPAVTEQITSGLQTLMQDIINVISTAAPTFVSCALDLISALIETILSNAEIITQGAVDLLIALADGISNNLPELIPAAVDAVLTIADTLLDNRDKLFEAAKNLIIGLAKGLINSIGILLEKGPVIVDKLNTAMIEAIPAVIEFAVDFCEAIGSYIANYDWHAVGANMYKAMEEAFSNAMHGDADYTEKMAQAEAERVSRYKDLTVEQINKMSADATKKLGELNNTFEKFGKSGIYDTSAMPEWMRTEYEHSGKSIEEYFDSQIANTEQLIEDLAAAREDAKTEFEKNSESWGLSGNFGDNAAKQSEEEAKKHFSTVAESVDDATVQVTNSVEKMDDATAKHQHYLAELAKENGEISASEYYDRIEAIANQLDEESELYEKYTKEVATGRRKLSEATQKELDSAEKTIYKSAQDKAKQEIKGVKSNLTELINEYKKSYDEIIKLRDKYKQKLMGESIFTVSTETDKKTGETYSTYTIENIAKMAQDREKYAKEIEALQKRGLADGLLDELNGLNLDQAMVFAKQMNKMSDEEFNKINSSYKKLDETTTQIANNRYQDDIDELQSGFIKEAEGLFTGLSDDVKNAGMNTVLSFIEGFDINKEDAFKSLQSSANDLMEAVNNGISDGTVDLTSTITSIVAESNIGDTLVDNIVNSISNDQGKIEEALQTIFDNTGIDMQIKTDVQNAAVTNSSSGYKAAASVTATQTESKSAGSTQQKSGGTQTIDVNLRLTSDGKRVIAEIVNEENKKIQIQEGN